jgi:putative peptidoglycan lipid II flippase
MNLLRTLASVSGMTMLSRITGLLRELLIARSFGASAYTDAFFIAFRIPNLLRRLFAEGAFSQAFVPILAEYKNQKGEIATKTLTDHVATALTWALLLTCLVGTLAAPTLVYWIASGLEKNPAAFDLTVTMTRIMFPYIGFMSLIALSAGILNTWRKFNIPAFTPVLLNISFILCALFLAPHLSQPIYALAIAVLIGGICQLGLQIPALMKIDMLPRIHFHPFIALKDPGVRRILKQMLPAIFAVSIAQISLIINTNIASHLTQGSVSWLSYADRLMEFPTALLGVALGTILLPNLSKANAEENLKEYAALLDWGLRLTFLLALPCAIGLATLSEGITATLFHYGKFSATDVHMTSQALIAYGVGLIGLILVKILAPGFYAKQDIRTPVKIGVLVLFFTQGLNFIFVPWLAHNGLALAISAGACLNALLLFYGLRKRNIYQPQEGWSKFLLQLTLALSVLASITFFGTQTIDWITLKNQPILRVSLLFLIIGIGSLAYFGTLYLLGWRPRDLKFHTSHE